MGGLGIEGEWHHQKRLQEPELRIARSGRSEEWRAMWHFLSHEVADAGDILEDEEGDDGGRFMSEYKEQLPPSVTMQLMLFKTRFKTRW